MNNQCPKICNCRLFNGKSPVCEDSKIMYKSHYCLGRDNLRWKSCKRFQLVEKVGHCPDYVMPNSLLSFEQIIKRISTENPVVY
jgi:hypothetical protein